MAAALLAVLLVALAMPGMPHATLWSLAAIDLLFLIFSTLFISVLERGTARALQIAGQIQAPLDVTLCSVAVFLAGGPLSPLSILYMLGIIASVILLDPRGVYRTAALSILQYCILVILEVTGILRPPDVAWGTIHFPGSPSYATYATHLLAVCSILLTGAYMANRVARIITDRNTQITAQYNDLRVLYDVANELGNTMDEDAMLNLLTTTLKGLPGASLCMIGLIDDSGRISIKAAAGAAPDMLAKLRNLRADMPQFSDLVAQGKPIIIEDVNAYAEYSSLKVLDKTRSVYMFPIKDEGKVLGALSLSFDRVMPLSTGYYNLLNTIATQAAVAIQRARLLCDSQRMAREMSILYDTGLHTGSTLSKEEVLSRTSSTIEKLMSPDSYYVALYEADTQTIEFEVFVENGQTIPGMKSSFSAGGLTARIIQTREPLLVQDWVKDGAEYNSVAQTIGDEEMLSYLGVPMIIEDKVVGVLSVQCARPMAFTVHDERLLVALAAQTGMAFENARLHAHAQLQAKLDSMTQVYNHGYFVELVYKAAEASQLTGEPLSLLMVDIDHFKSYNDIYGHVAGDTILKKVAQVLMENVKSTDAVGRWGGEEFCVLLPGSLPYEAERVAARIKVVLSELVTLDGQGNLLPSPTISQGISTFPEIAQSAASLIEQADAALYHAKRHGRDQLVISSSVSALSGAV